MNLICFPYAGASATIFNKWQSAASPQLHIVPVELAGRGHRIEETLYSGFDALIKDMMLQIDGVIKKGPYCLFGHSLGGKIAHEITRRLEATMLPLPRHLFISGRRAPLTVNQSNRYCDLTDEEFAREVRQLGGTQPEIFASQELLNFFLPILRHDFALSEVEDDSGNFLPIVTDMTAIFGTEEQLTAQQVSAWRNYTTGSFTTYFIKGGHFFVNSHTKEIVQLIKTTLKII